MCLENVSGHDRFSVEVVYPLGNIFILFGRLNIVEWSSVCV